MSRRLFLVFACALAMTSFGGALAWASLSAVPASAASANTSESSSPIADQGSNFNYRSEITSITPGVKGLSIEVLEFADRLVLTNHTGKAVTVYGYSGEPYARVQPNGTTEQNVRSPAVYLNTNFYGDVTVPASASASLPPKWVTVDRTGSFEWHDHRIHWMSPVTPPQVKDKGKRTLIFHWSVPISVGMQKGVVDGQLFWVPDSSKTPVAAIVALIVILLAAVAFVVWVRRRRARTGGAGRLVAGPGSGDDGEVKEAW
jgi:hypothetical protein